VSDGAGSNRLGKSKLGKADYPLAEKRPDLVRTRHGKALEDLTLAAIEAGEVALEDLRITPQALRQQAEISTAAGRPTLGRNFDRAAELIDVPQEEILRIYELLRPGRAKSKDDLLTAAKLLRDTYGAQKMAAFIEEAAAVYERRGLFSARY
jgi:propanediol dehydratase small subunit